MPLPSDLSQNPLTAEQTTMVRRSLSQVSGGVRPQLRPGAHIAPLVARREQLRAFAIGMVAMVLLAGGGITAVQLFNHSVAPETIYASSPGGGSGSRGAPVSSNTSSPTSSAPSPASAATSGSLSAPPSPSTGTPTSGSSTNPVPPLGPTSHATAWSTGPAPAPAPAPPTGASPSSGQQLRSAAAPTPTTPLLPDEGKPGWTLAPWARENCSDQTTLTLNQAEHGQRSANSEGQEFFGRESVAIYADAQKAQALLDALLERNNCGVSVYDSRGGTHFLSRPLNGYGQAGVLALQAWYNQQPDGSREYPPGGSYLLAARVNSTVVIVEGYGEWINSPEPDPRAVQEYGAILKQMIDRFGRLTSL